MGTVLQQVSFASGELSPRLLGRVDISRWQSGLSTCKNFIPRPFGGIENRPGLQFLQEVKGSANATRLLPFQFSTTQTYVLELGDQVMRFYLDGEIILNGGVPLEVATPWTSAELFELKYTQSADVMYFVHPDYQPRELRRTAVDEFEIAVFENNLGPFMPPNIDSTLSVSVDTVSGPVVVSASGDIFSADMEQSLFWIGHSLESAVKAWEAGKTISAGNVRLANGHYYKAVSGGTTGTLRPNHIEGVASDGGVDWRYIHDGYGVVLLTQYNSPTEMEGIVQSTIPDSLVLSSSTPESVDSVNFISSSGGYWLPEIFITGHPFSAGQVVVVKGVTGTDASAFNGTRTIKAVGPDSIVLEDAYYHPSGTPSASGASATVEDAGTGTAVASSRWAYGSWSSKNGYPATVNFFQQRLIFAATYAEPQTFWMSVIDAFNVFQKHQPLLDDDAIDGTIAARQVNTIKHIVPLNDLIFNTAGAEWSLKAGDAGVVPGGISVDAQTFYGSADVTPITTGTVALFVQEKGGIVRDLGYSFEVDGYSGSNLSQLSEHLFEGRKVKDWAYSQVPWDCIFLVMDDGTLLSLTYVRDQQIIGWARHETDGLFESVTTVSEGDEDAVYFVVKRSVNGSDVRYVERLSTRIADDSPYAFFVDSGLSYDGNNAGSTTMTLGVYAQAATYTAFEDGYLSGFPDGYLVPNRIGVDGDGTVFEWVLGSDLSYTSGSNIGASITAMFCGGESSDYWVKVTATYRQDGTGEISSSISSGPGTEQASTSPVATTGNDVVTVRMMTIVTGSPKPLANYFVTILVNGSVLDSVDVGQSFFDREYGFFIEGQSNGVPLDTGAISCEVVTAADDISDSQPGFTMFDLCGNEIGAGAATCVSTISGKEYLGSEVMTVGAGSLGQLASFDASTETTVSEDYIYSVVASAGVFIAGDVGDAIFFPDVDGRVLRLEIVEYNSPVSVIVKSSFTPPDDVFDVATTEWCFARNRLTGLDHLEGKEVSVLVDGNVHPRVTVESGAIDLQYPGCVVHAGLPYDSEMTTLPISSAEASVRDRLKTVRSVAMLVHESRGGFASSGGGKEYELKPDYRNDWDIPVPARTGLAEINVEGLWGYPGTVTVKQKDPLPMGILAIMPDVIVGGKS